MNAGVAQCAGLKLRRLVMVARRVTHVGTKRNRVALQAKLVDVAAREQAGIRRAVGNMARGASLGKLGGMLKDERPGLFDMALQANGILAGRRPQLCIYESSVLVVAVGALDQLFIHPVMKGLGKIRFGFRMASVA